jgi:signal transduction histidine kinase
VERAVERRQFTPHGGWVEIDLRREDESIRLRVSDSGCGIDPAFLPLAFDRAASGGPGGGAQFTTRLTDVSTPAADG